MLGAPGPSAQDDTLRIFYNEGLRPVPSFGVRECFPLVVGGPIGFGRPRVVWRQRWDRELAAFIAAPGEGQELTRLTEFIRPLPSTSFMWGIF